MVGVPGKSKGCSTCRRRKKGCDQKRPSCGQCLTSGYVCGGYQRDLTFVLHPATKAVEKAIFLPTKPRPQLLSAPLAFDRAALVTQCQDLFFDIYLPQGKCVVRDQHILRCGHPTNWTKVMQGFSPSESSLELAFAAFSISRVGRNRSDPRLVKESTKFYGKALKTLQKALYDPSRMYSEQVLIACLLLGLYETFEGTGGKSVGWVSHAQGAARIVELRGPERHAQFPAHILFLGTRLPIVYSAILRRKKTFLSDEEWLTIPWSNMPKTGYDMLVDTAAHIPDLLEQFDAARAEMPSTKQIQALQYSLQFARRLEDSFKATLTKRRPNSEPIVVKHEATGLNDSYPFETEFTYANHLFLNANLIYWSSTLVISTTVSEVEFLLASLGFQSYNMRSSTVSANEQAEQCALNIAQSIPYCLWPDMGDLGIAYMQFPMTLAFQYFMKSNNSKVCSWMLEMADEMQKNGKSAGFLFGRSPTQYLMHSYSTPVFEPLDHDIHETDLSTPTTRISSEHTPIPAAGSSSYTSKRMVPAFNTTKSQAADQSSDVVSLMLATDDSDFDAEYDMDSDVEAQSSPSDNSISPPMTIRNRDRSSSSRPGELAAETIGGSSTGVGDYMFLQENPSKYYIDRSENRETKKA